MFGFYIFMRILSNGTFYWPRYLWPVSSTGVHADLQMLGLNSMPTNRDALVHAYRHAVKLAHPDQGGSDAAFIAVHGAYQRIKLSTNGGHNAV